VRRVLDLLVALAGGLVALPVLILLALAVRGALGRPTLFVQQRAGRHGRPFRLLKFRSMTDARDAAGRLLPDEARIVPFGRLLRRSRLDELPELWNVLWGEMSLVGPRPLLPETVAGFGEAGQRRGAVRPGLTGWAQVNGNTALTDEDKLALDLWYIDHRSLALDVAILARTLAVLVGGEKVDVPRLAEARHHALRRYRVG
jgi:lipopolysaccharide/colanic/teichoic acid biosynthesis glycosyltransferase